MRSRLIRHSLIAAAHRGLHIVMKRQSAIALGDGERSLRFAALKELKLADRDLAAIFLRVEGNLLTLVEAPDAGAFERRRVHEHVLAAVVGLDEPEAFLTVVEFYGAGFHEDNPFTRKTLG